MSRDGRGLGVAKGFDILEFKDWLKKGDTTKPIARDDGKPVPQERFPLPNEERTWKRESGSRR